MRILLARCLYIITTTINIFLLVIHSHSKFIHNIKQHTVVGLKKPCVDWSRSLSRYSPDYDTRCQSRNRPSVSCCRFAVKQSRFVCSIFGVTSFPFPDVVDTSVAAGPLRQ